MSPRLARAFSAIALLTLASSLHAGVDHTFEIDTSGWQPQPNSMNLAGSFNGWSTSATPMQVNGGRVWSVKINLEEGETHHYKFVQDAGTPGQKWLNDPKADKSLEISDGNGGVNSGVIVGTDARKLPPAKPNAINVEAIKFNPADPLDLDTSGGNVRVRVRVQANDVQAIFPNYSVKTASQSASMTGDGLKRVGSERGLDVYAGVVNIPPGTDRRLYFSLIDGDATVDLGKIARPRKNDNDTPDQAAVAVELSDSPIDVPEWTKNANWYQIFVERFRNADASNDPGDFKAYERLVPWNGDWWKTQPGEAPGEENFYQGAGNVWNRRYGGDLQGVREKLPYLRSLGINAIYLNPIFEAESMHKYDTADFRHVDDNFGVRDSDRGTKSLGNRELFNLDGSPVAADYVETEDPKTWRWTKSDLLFLELVRDAHAQGFHIILDGVFNHVGRAHPYFQDVLKNGKRSKYADWFEITDFGDEKNWKEHADPYAVHGLPSGIQWRAWDKDNGHLPVFKKNAQTGLVAGPREHVLAVAKRWLDPDNNPQTRDGADGWRLDVPGDIPHPFWLDFRKACREAYADAYIVGEIWSPAQAWINKGDQFDATMNYQFAMAAQDFFVDQKTQIKPSEFNDRLVRLWFMYPHASGLAMQNLFDSHDTDRVVSMIVNPDRPYDGQNRPQDNAKENPTPYSARKPNETEWNRLLQMVAFQNTFIGAPMTYYGNEYGMWSPDDPSNRQPLPWDDKGPYTNGVGFNKKVFDGFQRFIAIRQHLKPLREGGFHPVTIDDAQNVYAFAREVGKERVYVAMNRSNEPRTVKLEGVFDGAYIDYADSKQVKIEPAKLDDPKSRPAVSAEAGAKPLTPTNGTLSIHLPPYGTAILAKP